MESEIIGEFKVDDGLIIPVYDDAIFSGWDIELVFSEFIQEYVLLRTIKCTRKDYLCMTDLFSIESPGELFSRILISSSHSFKM